MSIALIVAAVAVVVIVVWVILTQNRLVALRNECDEGWSNIEGQLKRRADLIPNMVAVVKGYAGFEGEVLERLTQARAAIVTGGGLPQLLAADILSEQAITGFMGRAEAYPDLKASQTFQNLQDELSRTEDLVASARKMYNVVVRRYNTRVESIPANLIAGLLGFTTREFYRLDDEGARAVPKVELRAT